MEEWMEVMQEFAQWTYSEDVIQLHSRIMHTIRSGWGAEQQLIYLQNYNITSYNKSEFKGLQRLNLFQLDDDNLVQFCV